MTWLCELLVRHCCLVSHPLLQGSRPRIVCFDWASASSLFHFSLCRYSLHLDTEQSARSSSEAHRVSSILSIRSRFRQTCTVLREVNAITRQGSAKVWRRCRWMLLGGDVRVCIAYSETDNEVENIVMDALKTIKSLHLGRSSVLYESMRSSVVVAQAAAHRLTARKALREATMLSGRLSIAIARGNDEVGRTDESTKQVHMTWVEDATKYENKQCLQRDVTEVDVSRRCAGRTCLMFILTRVVWRVHSNGRDPKRMSVGWLHVVTR